MSLRRLTQQADQEIRFKNEVEKLKYAKKTTKVNNMTSWSHC